MNVVFTSSNVYRVLGVVDSEGLILTNIATGSGVPKDKVFVILLMLMRLGIVESYRSHVGCKVLYRKVKVKEVYVPQLPNWMKKDN